MGEGAEERGFLRRIGAAIPEASGYRAPGSRRDTDARLREHLASQIDTLREKIAQLMTAADEEGEEDMRYDLDRVDSRMERTAAALRSADYGGVAFFESPDLPEVELERTCAYDAALLDDMDLLVKDVLGMKYETIGNLTLREVEGTLAAIELKVANRRDILDSARRP